MRVFGQEGIGVQPCWNFLKGIRPDPLVFSLKRDTLLETAQNIMNYAHQGQKRQSGEDYTEHLKRVSLGTQDLIKYDHKEMRELAAALGLLHDSVEDSKEITLSLLFSVVSCFGRAKAIFIQDAISRLSRTTQTYKAYTEDLFRDPHSEENLLARAVKLEDRIDNTKLGEEFDPETYRKAYESLAEATQTELLKFYKEKDVLFVASDQNEEPLSLYKDGVLLYDQDLFERACRQRFRIKIATNASDNLNFFLPEFLDKLLAIAERQDTSIDPNKVREHMWYLYVSSLDVLESFGRGGIQDILYYSLKREAMQFEGNRFDDAMRLPMLHQIQVLYVAGLYGLTGPDGKKMGKDAWRDPNSWKIPNHTMTYKDVRELFLGRASSDFCQAEGPTTAETVSQNQSSQQTLPPLRAYNSNENIIEWAKEVAKALHGDANRESGETKIGHIGCVAGTMETLVSEEYREAAVAAAWLHHFVKDHFPSIKVYKGKNGREPGTVYIQDLLGLRNAKDRKSVRGQVCFLLDRISPENESYKTLTDDIFDWNMDNPPALKVIAGILKSVDRFYKMEGFLKIDEKAMIEQLKSQLKGHDQASLFDFYLRNALLFITRDKEGNPIRLLDEHMNLIYNDDLLERCARQWHATRLAAMASDNIDFFIPYLEEKALYSRPNERDLGHGIFDHANLTKFVWDFYVQSFDCFERFGRKGIEDINYIMRKREHRDRSEIIEADFGFKPILSMMRRLHFASLVGLTDPRVNKKVEADAWRNNYQLYSSEEAEDLIRPRGLLQ